MLWDPPNILFNGYQGSFSGQMSEVDISPPSGALIKEKWRYISNLLRTYMLDVKDNPLKATS